MDGKIIQESVKSDTQGLNILYYTNDYMQETTIYLSQKPKALFCGLNGDNPNICYSGVFMFPEEMQTSFTFHIDSSKSFNVHIYSPSTKNYQIKVSRISGFNYDTVSVMILG